MCKIKLKDVDLDSTILSRVKYWFQNNIQADIDRFRGPYSIEEIKGDML